MQPPLFTQTPAVTNQAIFSPLLSSAGVRLHLKREDTLHPQVSGNKYRKLKYNIQKAKALRFNTLLTFGGAYSNHIAATAYAAQAMGLASIGVIRGEEIAHKWQANPTLALAHQQGMRFDFISREAYRKKNEPAEIAGLQRKFGQFYLIPEGGSNALAVKGCEEILTAEDLQNYDVICCAVGTGGTLAGIINSTQQTSMRVIGFSALQAVSLTADVAQWVDKQAKHWHINFDYTFGGYAKTNDNLLDFIEHFKATQGVQLEPIYTGKMLYAVFDLVKQGYFAKGSNILAIHTGGLQGLQGFAN